MQEPQLLTLLNISKDESSFFFQNTDMSNFEMYVDLYTQCLVVVPLPQFLFESCVAWRPLSHGAAEVLLKPRLLW